MLSAQRHGVFGGIQEVSLEAIQRFDGDLDAVTLEHGPELLITLHSPFPFVGGSAPPWQGVHGRIQRAGDQAGSHVGKSPSRSPSYVRACRAEPRRSSEITLRPPVSTEQDGAFEGVLLEAAADVGGGEIHRPKQRNFSIPSKPCSFITGSKCRWSVEAGRPDKCVTPNFISAASLVRFSNKNSPLLPPTTISRSPSPSMSATATACRCRCGNRSRPRASPTGCFFRRRLSDIHTSKCQAARVPGSWPLWAIYRFPVTKIHFAVLIQVDHGHGVRLRPAYRRSCAWSICRPRPARARRCRSRGPSMSRYRSGRRHWHRTSTWALWFHVMCWM